MLLQLGDSPGEEVRGGQRCSRIRDQRSQRLGEREVPSHDREPLVQGYCQFLGQRKCTDMGTEANVTLSSRRRHDDFGAQVVKVAVKYWKGRKTQTQSNSPLYRHPARPRSRFLLSKERAAVGSEVTSAARADELSAVQYAGITRMAPACPV